MSTNECSLPASKSSWDNQDFGDVSVVLTKRTIFIFASPPDHLELKGVKWRPIQVGYKYLG